MTHQILVQIGYAAALVGVTVFIHAIAIVLGRKFFVYGGEVGRRFGLVGDTIRLVLLSIWLFMAHGAAVGCWAAVFDDVGVSPTFEEALYFALSCYTTLGIGDIVPPTEWRLLAGAASANGLLLFGLSAAVMIDAATRHRVGVRP